MSELRGRVEFHIDTDSWAFLFSVQRFTDHVRFNILCLTVDIWNDAYLI